MGKVMLAAFCAAFAGGALSAAGTASGTANAAPQGATNVVLLTDVEMRFVEARRKRESANDATNAVMLTDSEVAFVAARRRRQDAAEAAKAANQDARVRVSRLAAKSGRSADVPAAVSPTVTMPTVVSTRKRLLSMDAESVPGKVVYAYAQGARTWCETNDLKAVTRRAAKSRYSKLKIIVAAKEAGKWDALKAGLAAADLEDEWLACQYIEDGDPAFVSATNAVVAAGIATGEEIAAFLSAARDN